MLGHLNYFTIISLASILTLSLMLSSIPMAGASHFCYDQRVGTSLFYTDNLSFNKQSYTPSDSPNIAGKVVDCNMDQVTVIVVDSCDNVVATESSSVPRNQGDYPDSFWVQVKASDWYFSGTYFAFSLFNGDYVSSTTMSFTGPEPFISSISDPQCSEEPKPSTPTATLGDVVVSSPVIPKTYSGLSSSIKVEVPSQIILCQGETGKINVKVTTLSGDPSTLKIKGEKRSNSNSNFIVGLSVGKWDQPSIGSKNIDAMIVVPSDHPSGGYHIYFDVTPYSGSSPFPSASDSVKVIVNRCMGSTSDLKLDWKNTPDELTIKDEPTIKSEPIIKDEPIIKNYVSSSDAYFLQGDLSGVTIGGVDFGKSHPDGIEFLSGVSITTGTRLLILEDKENNVIQIAPNSKIKKNENGVLDLLWGSIKVHTKLLNKCSTISPNDPRPGQIGYSSDKGLICSYTTPNAAAVPRGTEFILAYSPDDGISRIYLNEGSVEFYNSEKTQSATLVDRGDFADVNENDEVAYHHQLDLVEFWDQANEYSGFTLSASAQSSSSSSSGGGCLIATATYGSELAPQVQ